MSHHHALANHLVPVDLAGLWIPLVTPFADGAVDHAALHALTTRLSANGVRGFVACGSTGEAAALSHTEEDAVLQTVLQAAQGQPVMMGVSSSHMGQMLARVAALNTQPLTALLVAPPPYIRPAQDGLLHWFTRIADASTHPIVIYDIPYRTGATLELSTLRRLAEHPRIIGIKDCGGDTAKTQALIHDGQLQVLPGEDAQIFTSLALGANGAIAASAHAHTAHFVTLIQHIGAGDLPAARALWAQLLAHIHACFAEPNPAPIKALLAAQGEMRADMREPLGEASAALRERLSAIRIV